MVIRPGTRATIALTAIMLVLPNAFWKSHSPRPVTIRVDVRAAEVPAPAPPVEPLPTSRAPRSHRR